VRLPKEAMTAPELSVAILILLRVFPSQPPEWCKTFPIQSTIFISIARVKVLVIQLNVLSSNQSTPLSANKIISTYSHSPLH